MTDRYYDRNGARSHCASALVYDLREAHRFQLDAAKARQIADKLWSISDDTLFRWKVDDMMTERPNGHCPKCGTGWAGFLACDPKNACDWIEDGLGDPSPAWPPINFELSPLVRPSSVGTPAAPIDPNDGWGKR